MNDIQLEEELAQAKLTRTVLHRLWHYINPYKWRFLLVLGLELMWVWTDLIGPEIIRKSVDEFVPQKNLQMLALSCFAFAGALLLRYVLSMTEIRINMRAGDSFMNDLRKAIFRHVQYLSMSYFDKTKHGRIISRADRDVDNLEYPFVWGPIIVVSSLCSLVLMSVRMVGHSWKLYLAVLAVFGPMFVAGDIFRRKGMHAYRSIRETMARVTAYLAESISGVRVVQAFCRETFNAARFKDLNEEHKRNTIRASVVWNTFMPAIWVVFGLSMFVVIAYGGWMTLAGVLTIGKLIAFVWYVRKFFVPIFELSFLYNGILSGAAAAERIFLLLDTKPQIQDRDQAKPLTECCGSVKFESVHFRYGGDSPWVLKDISFSVSKGRSVALVGATGAGKSSVANLVPRFYEPQKGQVRIDGFDSRDLTLESLHAHMGIVLQENFLFSGTVMDNLRFGRPDATNEEIIDTAKSLGSHGSIMRMAKGYQTEIKERGAGLSLGERQLICFTRAFVASPRILILDEATSAVDARTETILQEALAKLIHDRTSIIVAHRLSTIKHADEILVMDQGRIVERGTHDELVRQEGKYFEMYQEYVR